jgi:hypothetical protein
MEGIDHSVPGDRHVGGFVCGWARRTVVSSVAGRLA